MVQTSFSAPQCGRVMSTRIDLDAQEFGQPGTIRPWAG
jgi:hypothetical protein